jgi:hypothetical protein
MICLELSHSALEAVVRDVGDLPVALCAAGFNVSKKVYVLTFAHGRAFYQAEARQEEKRLKRTIRESFFIAANKAAA